jgi:protein-tyrosine phosphatase
MVKVLFVCLGNICRSPTAHAVFAHKVAQRNLQHIVEIDSAGTAAYHINKQPDIRSQREGKQRGYELGHLRARQVCGRDFSHFDYILAMDNANLSNLRQDCPKEHLVKLALFLRYGDSDEEEVPDPYYGGEEGFQHVLDLVEDAADGLLEKIIQQRQLS